MKKLKPSYKFPIKSNFNGNDINKKTSKVNNQTIELNKIKESEKRKRKKKCINIIY